MAHVLSKFLTLFFFFHAFTATSAAATCNGFQLFAKEDFLKLKNTFETAEIISATRLPDASTDPIFLATLKDHPDKVLLKKASEMTINKELAAYELNHYLQFDNFPLATKRIHNGELYLVEQYLDDAVTLTKHAPKPIIQNPSFIRNQLFEYIIGDIDHHGGDILVTSNNQYYYIDAGRAFLLGNPSHQPEPFLHGLPPIKSFGQKEYLADKDFYDQLAKANIDEVRLIMKKYLKVNQLMDAVVDRIQSMQKKILELKQPHK